MHPFPSTRRLLYRIFISTGLVSTFILGHLAWQTLPHTVLFEPLKISPTEKFVLPGDEPRIDLPLNPRFKTSLGKQVLILDLETRPLKSTKDYRRGKFDWRELDHISRGVFNHYTYATIHGYDYKLIHAEQFKDRHATWIKPSALANHISNYKFIVFLDADATFRFLHIPIEWMLNYWRIEPKHSVTMALDPWDPQEPQYNSDRFNRTYANTGFMIIQNNTEIMSILKDWHECPDNTRYPMCSQWKRPKFHEQSAFGEYIRYDYNDSIKEIPCGEANGFPGVHVSHCQGKLIRHYYENMMNAITMSIQKVFADNADDIITYQEKNVIRERLQL
ncbi:hypothetical protein C7974DRAFT_433127 [Boeremia exigua]|uniref:uncharacterized protein n=1 Tax=Boeremia exigua TaxID=749465 RepID=UPI001E8DF114|nr:uncharacterized protein C7974DRAFT_433127 [Boeremia exigua]KAH6632918.1 hypothetical protein C7974DRAFT_433127 [Boeremia exigua]